MNEETRVGKNCEKTRGKKPQGTPPEKKNPSPLGVSLGWEGKNFPIGESQAEQVPQKSSPFSKGGPGVNFGKAEANRNQKGREWRQGAKKKTKRGLVSGGPRSPPEKKGRQTSEVILAEKNKKKIGFAVTQGEGVRPQRGGGIEVTGC